MISEASYTGEIVVNSKDTKNNSLYFVCPYYCVVLFWLFKNIAPFEENEITLYLNSKKISIEELLELLPLQMDEYRKYLWSNFYL